MKNNFKCEMILNHLETMKRITDSLSLEIGKEMREQIITMEGLT